VKSGRTEEPSRLTAAEVDQHNALARLLGSREQLARALGVSTNCLDRCVMGTPWAVERVRAGLSRAFPAKGGVA
jgi:hypothetical protein